MCKVNKYYVFLTNCFDNLFCQKHLQYLPNLFLIMWITVGHQCPTVWCTANGQCCTYTEKYTWTSVTWFRKCWDSSSAVLKIGCCLLILIFHVIFPFSVSIRMYCTVNPAAGQRFLCKHGLIKKNKVCTINYQFISRQTAKALSSSFQRWPFVDLCLALGIEIAHMYIGWREGKGWVILYFCGFSLFDLL